MTESMSVVLKDKFQMAYLVLLVDQLHLGSPEIISSTDTCSLVKEKPTGRPKNRHEDVKRCTWR
jgi:hypothetical protein